VHSRIDKVVMETDDHGRLTVSGRITWDPDEVSATFVAAVVQLKPQGRIVMASGRSTRTFRRSDDWWQAEVVIADPDDQFQYNLPVAGWAVASVKEANGGSEPYPWETDNLVIERATAAVAQ
jgi:hypothetical protein